jgi:hypothetical protein
MSKVSSQIVTAEDLISGVLMNRRNGRFVEVRVHEHTGEVRVSRWLSVVDCGSVVNPRTAISQLRGGIIMGIGMALTEETLFDDRRGRIINPSLAEYHVPVNLDIPEIESYFLTFRMARRRMVREESVKSVLPARPHVWQMPCIMQPVSGFVNCRSLWTSSCRFKSTWRSFSRRMAVMFIMHEPHVRSTHL